jgi:hypothetical protein
MPNEQISEPLLKENGLAAVVAKVPELKAVASELFGRASVETAMDPEIPDAQYVVVSVQTAGDPREVADRRREWYRRTEALLGEDCDKVQLLIDITR